MTNDYRHNGGPSMTEATVNVIGPDEADVHENPPPYFPFWWDDFWASCRDADMRPDEIGGFLAALTLQWKTVGRFTKHDLRKMVILTGWDVRTCKPLIRKLLAKGKLKEDVDGRVTHDRMAREIALFCSKKKAALIREERKRQERDQHEADEVISAGKTAGTEPLRSALRSSDTKPSNSDDRSEKYNEINKSDTTDNTTRDTTDGSGHARVTFRPLDNNTPPTPPLGGQPPKENSRGKRAAKTRAEAAQRQAQVAALVAAYNDRATTHGWRRCEVITDQRAKRLLKRVAEIGGPDRFVSALDAIPGDDWLSGRVAGRDGSMFRLDIDRLLSTGSGMGDVLARMLEVATAPSADPDPVNGQAWGWWRGKEDQLRSLDPDRWEAAIAKHRPNGTWPWWIMGAPPGHDECVVPDAIVDKYGYVEIYQGKIHHA